MKRVIILLVALIVEISAFAGVLKDKFQAFLEMPGVSTYYLPNLIPWSEGVSDASSGYAIASPDMILYSDSYRKFIKGLPVKYRLNKTADGAPLIYFSQPSSSKPAEVLFMMSDDNGLYAVTFMRLTPKEGVKFKKFALKKL